MKYVGIGPDNTPKHIMQQMQTLAMLLSLRGIELRSMRATMADRHFEAGCNSVKGAKTIRVSTLWPKAIVNAEIYHGAAIWIDKDENERGLVAAQQCVMLGDTFNDPAKFVITWTPGKTLEPAIKIAGLYGLPVFDLALPGAEAALWASLNGG